MEATNTSKKKGTIYWGGAIHYFYYDLGDEKSNCVGKCPLVYMLKVALIKQTKYVKFLRVFLDENLLCKYHLIELSKKLSRNCGMFFKIRHFLPIKILICVYNSIFSPLSTWQLSLGTYLWNSDQTSILL